MRSRTICPWCKRSIAVTFNAKTGDAYIRSHNIDVRKRCPGSRATVPMSERNRIF